MITRPDRPGAVLGAVPAAAVAGVAAVDAGGGVWRGETVCPGRTRCGHRPTGNVKNFFFSLRH